MSYADAFDRSIDYSAKLALLSRKQFIFIYTIFFFYAKLSCKRNFFLSFFLLLLCLVPSPVPCLSTTCVCVYIDCLTLLLTFYIIFFKNCVQCLLSCSRQCEYLNFSNICPAFFPAIYSASPIHSLIDLISKIEHFLMMTWIKVVSFRKYHFVRRHRYQTASHEV